MNKTFVMRTIAQDFEAGLYGRCCRRHATIRRAIREVNVVVVKVCPLHEHHVVDVAMEFPLQLGHQQRLGGASNEFACMPVEKC